MPPHPNPFEMFLALAFFILRKWRSRKLSICILSNWWFLDNMRSQPSLQRKVICTDLPPRRYPTTPLVERSFCEVKQPTHDVPPHLDGHNESTTLQFELRLDSALASVMGIAHFLTINQISTKGCDMIGAHRSILELCRLLHIVCDISIRSTYNT